MSRIDRIKHELDPKVGRLGLHDIFDNKIIFLLRVTQDEFDAVLEKATDEQLDIIVKECDTFSDKRKLVTTINQLYTYL
jgi:hypothetical protein